MPFDHEGAKVENLISPRGRAKVESESVETDLEEKIPNPDKTKKQDD